MQSRTQKEFICLLLRVHLLGNALNIKDLHNKEGFTPTVAALLLKCPRATDY